MKSLLKSGYLAALKAMPSSSRKHQVAFLMSFNDNDGGLIEALYQEYQEDFLLFYTPRIETEIKKYRDQGIKTYLLTSSSFLKGSFSRLKSCQVIIADNYFAELSLLKGKRIIQIWHAIGAIKRFGWEDPKTADRSNSDKQRFQAVYDSFTDIVVGSQAMGDVFVSSYHVSPSVIRNVGAPRADQLIQKNQNHAKALKKTTLYVPTYRDTINEITSVVSDAIQAFAQIPEREFLIKLHPEVADKLVLEVPANVAFTQEHLVDLYDRSDSLISDYSSCVFDFNLRWPERPILLFCPDREVYDATTGLQSWFTKIPKEQLAERPQELTAAIQHIEQLTNGPWLDAWQTYNTGHSVEELMELIRD